MPGRAVLLLSLAAFASAAAVITGFAVSYGLFQLVNGPLADRIGY